MQSKFLLMKTNFPQQFLLNQFKLMTRSKFLQRTIKPLSFVAMLFATLFALPAMAQEGWQLTGNRNANALSQIGTTNGVALRFATKNTSWLLLDSLGNFGVRTQTPKYPLDVSGKLRLIDGSQGVGKVLTSDSNGVATWLTPASNPWMASGNNLYNINTGNIGIGTATPKAKLDVNGDAIIYGVKVGRGSNIFNTFVGAFALDSNSTGNNNTAVGYGALSFNKTGNNNTALGDSALRKNTTGSDNTATGSGALANSTIGKWNTANGLNALNASATGSGNTAVGDSAIAKSTSANSNTAIGYKALINAVTGGTNTAVGQQALQFVRSGTLNTAVGFNAGTSGTDSAILTNATAIGANAKVTRNSSLVLGNNANVGIGTTAPLYRLDLAGKLRVVDGSQQAGYVLTSDSTVPGLAKWKLAPGSNWVSTGANAYYGQSGNVGIGTMTPSQKLEINNTLKFTNNSTDGNDGVMGTAPFAAGLNIVGINTDNTSRKFGIWGGITQYENNLGNFFAGRTEFPYSVLDENGNAGIGTTDIQQRLNINGNIQFNNADLPKSFIDEVGGTSPLFTMGVNFHEANKNDVYRGGAFRLDTRDGAQLNQWLSRLPNSTAEDLLMALNQNAGLALGTTFSSYGAPDNGAIIQGNVGIGKTSPGWKLDVAGDIMADGGYVRVSGNNGLYFQDWGGGFYMNDDTWIRTNNDKNIWTGNGLLGSNGGLTVGYGGATPPYNGAIIAGNLGVGTNNPYSKMHVQGGYSIFDDNSSVAAGGYIRGIPTAANAGALLIGGNFTGGEGEVGMLNVGPAGTNRGFVFGNWTAPYYGINVKFDGNGTIRATAFTPWSDKRFKKDIKSLSTDYSKRLLSVKSYTYKYDKDAMAKQHIGTDERTHYGVIAQELEQLFPDVVYNNEDGFKSVNYMELIPVVIQSIQEQQKQIDTKDATITKQQEQITDLQAQMKIVLSRLNSLQSNQEACCNMIAKTVVTEQPVSLTTASLEQNIPNPPSNHATKIGYNVPKGTTKAEMVIIDNFGKTLKTINLSVSGKGQMNIDTRGLTPGTYSYTLLVDGKMIDTKQMVVGTN